MHHKWENMYNLLRIFSVCIILLILLANLVKAESEHSGRITLELQKTEMYLGESTAVTVNFLTEGVTIHNMSYPIIKGDDFSVDDFAPPHQSEFMQNSVLWTSYRFTSRITPNRSGIIRIPTVRLSGEITEPTATAGAFFGETTVKKINFATSPVELRVLPLPASSKPSDFYGAVGRFSLKRSAKPTILKSGEPVTLKTQISGIGNFQATFCPSVNAKGFKSYPVQSQLFKSSLICNQVLIPETADAIKIPAARFSFFNISSARYETLQTSTVSLTLSDNKPIQTVITTNSTFPSSSKLISRTESSHLWHYMWVLFPICGLLLTSKYFYAKRRQLVGSLHKKQPELLSPIDCIKGAERALDNNDTEQFYNDVFRALTIIKSIPLTDIMHQFSDIEVSCDAVRYGKYRPELYEMEDILRRLKSISF